MADNIPVKDSAGNARTIATTDNGGVHTPHHRDPEAIAAISVLAPIAPGTSEDVAIGATSAQSAAISGTIVRLDTDADCRVLFGADPTADGADMRLRANSTEYFLITSGQKIAVIGDSGSEGTLNITVAA